MSAKKLTDKKEGQHLRKTPLSLEIKQEIIAKHEDGRRVRDLVAEFKRPPSTICTILKQKEAIKQQTPAKGINIMSGMRNNTHDEMENLLLLWIKEKQIAGESISEPINCEKARHIYSDLQITVFWLL